MSAAVNLYLSTLLYWTGLAVAVGVLVYLCAKACEWVSHEWKLRKVWRDTPLTRATPGGASHDKPFDWKTG